jgi:hypothetical protein
VNSIAAVVAERHRYLLDAVRIEGVKVLPSVTLKNDDNGVNENKGGN